MLETWDKIINKRINSLNQSQRKVKRKNARIAFYQEFLSTTRKDIKCTQLHPEEYFPFPEAIAQFNFQAEKGKVIHLQEMWFFYESDLKRLKTSNEGLSIELFDQITSIGSKKRKNTFGFKYYDKLTIKVPFIFSEQMLRTGVYISRINDKFYVGEFKLIVVTKKLKKEKCPVINGTYIAAPMAENKGPINTQDLPYRTIMDKSWFTEDVEPGVKFDEPLTLANYSFLFREALKIEFEEQENDLKTYNQAKARLERRGKARYALFVENLVEKRPSVVVGDEIKIRQISDKAKKVDNYLGRVVAVEKQHVVFTTHVGFDSNYQDTARYTINFILATTPYNRMFSVLTYQQNIIALAKPLEPPPFVSYLFPSLHPNVTNSELFNKPMAPIERVNEEQEAAITSITKYNRNFPFIIFGPPGTGKTHTLVECILRLLKYSKKRIIVCTPSNASADNIYDRISSKYTFGKSSQLLRFNAYSRCGELGLDYDEQFEVLEREKTSLRLLVITSNSAMLFFGLMQFDYLFIDEAGNGLEPESLIPIQCCRCQNNFQLILAGDPQQLGPIVASKNKKTPLALSLLERIAACPSYQKQNGKYDSKYIVKLLRNYRSHETILRKPSEMFYDNELIATKPRDSERFVDWPVLPKKNFPIVFYSLINSIDAQEKNSPSWFNMTEVKKVKAIIKKLLKYTNKKKINKYTIGIVTPYLKQKQKINIMLQKYYPQLIQEDARISVSVGSVEFFQGQEKDVIIITTVRSRPDANVNNLDVKAHIGFLASPKRLNVAITRAKGLLIFVGNAKILNIDPHWNQVIEYCSSNRVIIGHDPIRSPETA